MTSTPQLSCEARAVIQRMRKCLTPVAEGEQVLARWSDDGWYYQGNRTIRICIISLRASWLQRSVL